MGTRAQNQFHDSLAGVSEARPRDVRHLPGLAVWPVLKIWLALALFFISLLILIPVVFLLVVDKDFLAQQRTLSPARGIVLQVKKLPNGIPGNNAAAYVGATNLSYSFRLPGGGTFYGQEDVLNNTPFALLKKGASLPIVFDPEDPSFNGIAGVLGKNGFPIAIVFSLPLMGLFYAAIFGWPLLKPLRQTFLARKIYREGELAIGQVDFVTKKGGGFGYYGIPYLSAEVLFHFHDSDGKIQAVRQKCDNEWLLQKLDVGSEVQVVYLSRRPRSGIFLEAFIA